MKRTLLAIALAATCLSAHAATFNYHGNLQDAGKPAQGSYDIELTLYSAPSGGSVIGGPLAIYAVPVRDGSFSTEADFGPLAKPFAQAYMGVRVRAAGKGDYAALDTRSVITPDVNTSCPGSWSLDGNAGNPSASYLGTADANHYLTFKVEGAQVANAFLNGATTASWIGGGSQNFSVGANGSFIGGGGSNTLSTSANGVGAYGVVGGGQGNQAGVAGGNAYGVVGGGHDNQASGYSSTVGGGEANKASGNAAMVGGGDNNVASGDFSSVVGGWSNVAAGYASLAAGNYASASHDGAFVWADESTNTVFASSAAEQFDIRATGGVGINTANGPKGTEPLGGTELTIRSSAGYGHETWIDLLSASSVAAAIRGFNFTSEPTGNFALRGIYNESGSIYRDNIILVEYGHIAGGGSTAVIGFNRDIVNNGVFQVGTNPSNGNGAYLTAGGIWTSASSRAFKDGFAHVDALDVLGKLVAMPVQTWFYKGDHDEGRHMGPVAEDFAHAFGLGNDEKHVGSVDEAGVAFAAIQGLNEKVETENAGLKSANAELRAQVRDLAARLSELEAKSARR